MIQDLPGQLAALPDDMQQIAERLFHIAMAHGAADPPPAMRDWVVHHFGAVDDVRQQVIIKVLNRWTLEGALFNPLRARRPSAVGDQFASLDDWIEAELSSNDIFADPLNMTTADVFGRIHGQHCVSASNVAKFDGWHGLVIFDEPNPLHVRREPFRDYLDVAWRWLLQAHKHDASARYPIIIWNCLPKSGASQMHGHMQVALANDMPYAKVIQWQRAAEQYAAKHASDYLNDLFAVHDALGLSVPCPDGIRACAHLTPLRSNEMLLLAAPGDAALMTATMVDTLYDIQQRMIHGCGVRSFNLTIALPPLVAAPGDWQNMPVLVRIGDRGNPLMNRSDIGAMELYGTGCITADPFATAAAVRE